MLPNVGMPELLVILIIVLLLFGTKRLPEVGRSLGRSIKAFKDGMNEGMESKETKSESDESKKNA